jgi:quercetin dioxygenase-like cupin family protein
MLSKRNISICGMVGCLLLSLAISVPIYAADTTDQILTHYEEIFKANPLKPGEAVQMIKVAEDNTITFYVARIIEGAEVKPHFHKTHNETVYVIKGTGRQMVNDKWFDIQPGSVHFNPMTKVHSTKNTGSGELVIISIFTPAMKEMDRNFVQ